MSDQLPLAAKPMDRPQHQIEVLTSQWPSNLKSCEDAAGDLGISPERLRALADRGYAPHYRIDGGDPQFRISELKQWAGANLVDRTEGRDLPSPIRIVVPAPAVSDYRKVPQSLREISGLKDISGELMRSGIYFLCRDSALLYVGQSVNVAQRIVEHFRRYEFDAVFFLPWPADDLNRLEAALIRHLRPPLNGKGANGTMRTSFGDKAGDASVIAALTNAPSEGEEGAPS